MPDGNFAEWPIGVFMLTTPTRKVDKTGAIVRDIEAYDQLRILKDDRTVSQYLIAAGTNFIAAIKSILISADISAYNLTPSTATLPVDREWDGGTPKLTIINELLAGLNYSALFFDEEGSAVARPYVTPDQRAAEYTYVDDQYSVMYPDAEETLDYFNVPNTFILVVSQPDRSTLRSAYVNANPSSPTSTVSRGRTITDYRRVDAPDQTTLDALAASLAYKASQIYQTISVSTAIMPFHSQNDVINLRMSALGIDAKYEEIRWSYDLKAGAQMRHEIRRVVAV